MKIFRTGGNRGNREKLCSLFPSVQTCFPYLRNLRDLRANAFLSEFAAVQQLRQLAA
jgi:hypothetical protein